MTLTPRTEYTNRAATNWAWAEKLEIDTSSLWTPSNKLLFYAFIVKRKNA